MPEKTKASKRTTVELMLAITEAVESKNYFFTTHATTRLKQRRNVDQLQVIRILKSDSKYHEPKKDTYSKEFQAWNYAVRSKTIDDEDVRIILTFDENDMLIITVINLDE